MLLNSITPDCYVCLTPCDDDHGSSLHVNVALHAHRGDLREHPDRLICPGGATEAAVWFGAVLEGLIGPGDCHLLLCDAALVHLVSLHEESGQDPLYGLVVEVPERDDETPVDGVGLLVLQPHLW